jgi:hypothetical protein
MMKNSTPTMAMDEAMLVRGDVAGTADMGKAPANAGNEIRTSGCCVGTTLSHLWFGTAGFVNNACRPVECCKAAQNRCEAG